MLVSLPVRGVGEWYSLKGVIILEFDTDFGLTLIMRLIAHIGVIAPLCDTNPSQESLNSISAHISESSHRGAMIPTYVPLSGVRLHAIACGSGTETLPQFVCLAVYHRDSTAVCVAGAERRINEVFY